MNPLASLAKRAKTRHLHARHLTQAELRLVASYADTHGNEATQREFNLSYFAVRRAMRLHGIKPWPIGNPRIACEPTNR